MKIRSSLISFMGPLGATTVNTKPSTPTIMGRLSSLEETLQTEGSIRYAPITGDIIRPDGKKISCGSVIRESVIGEIF